MIKQLEQVFKQELDAQLPSRVVEAMGYSLLSSGKRVRPQLIYKMLEDYGVHHENTPYVAGALECIHTYSLIHDDLPALDNDDMRRFMPTNHKVFGEDIAILAGDGLLTMAFSLLAKAGVDARFVEILARNAGTQGMILGQEIDILDDIHSIEDLKECYTLKTGGLFSAAFEFATLLADDKDKQKDAQNLGALMGIAFQLQDDLLEVKSDAKTIGKSTESDLDRDIKTITSFLSLEDAENLLDEYFSRMDPILDSFNFKTTHLKDYIDSLRNRSL